MSKTSKYNNLFNMFESYLNNLSHAYIFCANNNPDSDDILNNFIKQILTKEVDEENKSIIFKQIDEGNHSELIKIKAESMEIKKEQIENLKTKLITKALNSKYRIYIIYEAEKLNESAANSMLKLLEEPEDNIIAILTTNNINNILSTIVSRCQLINIPFVEEDLKYDNLYYIFKNIISKEEYHTNAYGEKFINNSINFVLKYEEYKSKTICFSKEWFHNYFNSREQIEIALQIMILFYKDVMYHKNNRRNLLFKEHIDQISKVESKNNTEIIIKKINVLMQAKELIKNNINVNLLIDSLIFDLEGVSL
jgi:DNA polymerase-3 subunit delta'